MARKQDANSVYTTFPRITGENITLVELVNQYFNEASIDAANRLRVSEQITLGDYRQINDDLPYFFDEVTDRTATTNYVKATGGVEMNVTANGDYAIRQTFQSHNYAAGKSQIIELTFSEFQPQTNVIKRAGYYRSSFVAPYNSNIDGIYIESSEGNVWLCIQKNGTEVLKLRQSDWQDRLDGSGNSGVIIDWTKFNVLVIDFLYLGGTQIRFGFILDGQIQWVYRLSYANNFSSPFVESPMQPIRYEIRSTGGAGSFNHICAQVSSEGSIGEVGIMRSYDTGANIVSCPTIGVQYNLMAIRLKDGYENISINPVSFSALSSSNDDFIIRLLLNPTLGETVFTPDPTGAIEIAIGDGGVVTGGRVISSKLGAAQKQIQESEESARRIGVSINGTKDVLVLAAVPLSVNLNISATLKLRQLI